MVKIIKYPTATNSWEITPNIVMQLLILEGKGKRFEVKYQLLGLRIDSMATNCWELVPYMGAELPTIGTHDPSS